MPPGGWPAQCNLFLPLQVGLMRYLPAFRISINQLPLLTKGIGGLESVADLLLADNFLQALPPEIGLLTSITRLRATNNRLESLPDELANLQVEPKILHRDTENVS